MMPRKGMDLTAREKGYQTVQHVPQVEKRLTIGKHWKVTQLNKCERRTDAVHKAGRFVEVKSKLEVVRDSYWRYGNQKHFLSYEDDSTDSEIDM